MRHPLKWLAAVVMCAGVAIPASPAQAKVPRPNGRIGGARWRRAMLVLAIALAVAFATPAYATVVDHGRFTSEEHFGPMVVSDMPCLEGKEFIATGAEFIRGSFVDAGDAGFHFFFLEKHEGTAVPVDGQGPPTWKAVIPAPRVIVVRRRLPEVLHETRLEQALDGAVEGAWAEREAAVRERLDVGGDAQAMSVVGAQREQDVQDG